MGRHLFHYQFLEVLRMKWVIGWTLLFPLILATAFYAGFGNLIKAGNEPMDPIPVAVVTDGDAEDSSFMETLRGLADGAGEDNTDNIPAAQSVGDNADNHTATEETSFTSGEKANSTAAGNISSSAAIKAGNRLFQLRDASGAERIFVRSDGGEEKALELLKSGEVAGVYYDNGDREDAAPTLTVAENGMEQTVLAQFLKTYINYSDVITGMVQETIDGLRSGLTAGIASGSTSGITSGSAPEIASESTSEIASGSASGEKSSEGILSRVLNVIGAIRILQSDEELLEPVTFRKDLVDANMQYFFSLIAMASLFSSWMSTIFMKNLLADQSDRGIRFEVSPASRFGAVAAAAAAGILITSISNVIVVLYIEYVLGLRFHVPFGFIVIVTTLGAAVGISSGICIATFTKGKDSLNNAIPLLFTMVSSFLSGLMVGGMRQLLEVYAPVVNRINPASAIADALYCAGTYGIDSRYWENCGILAVMTALSLTVAAVRLRGKSYDHL